jgi:hydroxypyruvate reductase
VPIKNRDALAVTPARQAALAVADAALAAIDTGAAIRRAVELSGDTLRVAGEPLPLAPGRRLRLVAVGKCAITAAAALAARLGDRLADGIVLDVADAAGRPPASMRVLRGTHPMPSAANVAATREILRFLSGGQPGDTVLCVVSGGGSTLLCLPPEGGAPDAEAAVLQALMRAGATIQEINTVRKHASLARGGQLARAARPARVVGLLFSDVPGGTLDLVASGPTVRDPSTVADAKRVLARYGLPASAGLERFPLVETPKDGAPFDAVHNVVLVSNLVALDAMAAAARSEGLAAEVQTATLAGEARGVAGRVVRDLRAAPRGTALLYGGETTVTVRGSGRGGRNLELALAALGEVRDDELVLTLASDGRDNGHLAGAIADAVTRAAAERAGADPASHLAANDSYGFFERVPHALETGSTGANVADLIVALRQRSPHPETAARA